LRIITGDIGGTKTALELGELDQTAGKLSYTTLVEERFVSANYPSLEAIVLEFQGKLSAPHKGGVSRACFGVAGPVANNFSKATNLPWNIDGAVIAKACGIDQVLLLNDFHTVVLGIELLQPADWVALNDKAVVPTAPIAVLGAGTGLGEAFLIWGGNRYEAVPSEGGHCEFGPRNELELDMLRHLIGKLGHVSYERVCSGRGIANIYDYLAVASAEGKHGLPPESKTLKTALESAADRPAAISEAGSKGDPLARKALEVFAGIYGAEAGNLALKVMASGGVYLAGGVTPKVLDVLKEGHFMRGYLDKGRLTHLVENVPVRVILHKKLPILGAAVATSRM
jgi:glucokinase